MLFRRISHRIALQFTGFVFGLLLLTGLMFLLADVMHVQRQTLFRLERMAQAISVRLDPEMTRIMLMPRSGIPPHLLAQVRVLDAESNPRITGSFFLDTPVIRDKRLLSTITVEDQEYVLFTMPFERNGKLAGFIQIADNTRPPMHALPGRTALYLLISMGISALTYLVGLAFARRNLLPAEQMMERLEQFTQDASHELRTPLTAVGTSMDLALLRKDQEKHLRTAKKELAEVSVLIDRLLELARLDVFALQKESTDFTRLLTEVIDRQHAAAIKKNVRIEQDLAQDITVEGDPSLLKQVASNLLSNAIKFNEPGGTVRMTLTKDAWVVEDTGKGIAASALPHIFDRFYQEESSRTKPGDGVGLGLALVKRIVELHGWTIGVESAKGKGARFTVRFS